MTASIVECLKSEEAEWVAKRVLAARESLLIMRTDDTLSILYRLAKDSYRQGRMTRSTA